MKKLFVFILAGIIAVSAGQCLANTTADEELKKKAEEYRNLGYQYQKAGRLDEAILYYTKAVWSDSLNAEYHNDLGVAYEMKKMYEKAEEEYYNALKLNPNFLKAHTNLACLYESQGKTDKVIFHLQERVRKGDSSDVWTQRCQKKLEELRGSQMTKKEIASVNNIQNNPSVVQKTRSFFTKWLPKSKSGSTSKTQSAKNSTMQNIFSPREKTDDSSVSAEGNKGYLMTRSVSENKNDLTRKGRHELKPFFPK